jgi:hypothetical protein
LFLSIFVAAAFFLSASAAAQEPEDPSDRVLVDKVGPPVTVHGVVLNAATGEPLAHALVSAEADPVLGALTNGQGRFEMANVPSGMMTFSIRKPGFRDPAAGGSNESQRQARLAAQTPDMIFSLRPVGTLDGQVQLSTGDPGASFSVKLLRQATRYGRIEWEFEKVAHTDDQGFYHFSDLEPGIYTLHSEARLENKPISPVIDPASVRGIHRDGYPCVYYPNARTVASAGQIHVGPGEHAHGDLDLSLEPFYPVTFAVRGPDGQAFQPDMTSDLARRDGPIPVELLDADNRLSGYDAHYDRETGTVQAELPNGMYTLRAFVDEKTAGKAAMGDSRAGYLMGLVPFTLAGHALRNLPLALFPPAGNLLHVHPPVDSRTSGESPAGNFNGVSRVWLSPAGDPLLARKDEMEARRDGDTFNLMYNPVSPQWLHIQVQAGFCAGTSTGSGINPAREPIVNNPAGPNPPLDLQLRNDCAQLVLALPSSATAEVPGLVPSYKVYVVPDFETTETAVEREVSAPGGGKAEIGSLTPGRYHVYTFAEPVELPYHDPDAMAQMGLSGQIISLLPGDKAQLVLELPTRP